MSAKVKCVSCGFLSRRSELRPPDSFRTDYIPPEQQPEYLEVTKEQRNFREPAERIIGERAWFECLAAAYDLGNEKHGPNDLAWKDVINADRECSAFMEYVLGHTPKEHVVLRLQEKQEAREDARDEALREFQAKQEKDAADRHVAILKAAKFGLFWEVAVVGIVATIILAIATIWAANIERGDGSVEIKGPVTVATEVPPTPTPSPIPPTPTPDTAAETPQ